MNQKLTAVLRQRSRLLGLFVGGLGLALLIASVVGYQDMQNRLANLEAKPQVAADKTGETKTTQQNTPAQPADPQPAHAQGAQAQAAQSPQTNTQTSSTPATGDVTNPAPAEAKIVQVSLSVNKVFQGTVTLPETDNHCDVLREALKTGVISNLEMRYNSSYKTDAVYKINGIGESDTIGWVFEISGRDQPYPSPWSPPTGCSHVKIENGDSVNWKYVN